MADTRKLKVYEMSGKNYHQVPTIMLKGNWLREYGFEEHTLIQVNCENGKLTITQRDPDPEPPVPAYVEDVLTSLSEKQLRVLEKSLRNRQR